MIWIILSLVIVYISYIVYKDPTITNRSISYSYYEDRETAVVWGAFANAIGILIIFSFPSILTLIAGICLALVPIAGDFQRKPITYIHYTLALAFYVLMLYYSGSFTSALSYAVISFIMFYNKRHEKDLSMFWIEVIGILLIILNLI